MDIGTQPSDLNSPGEGWGFSKAPQGIPACLGLRVIASSFWKSSDESGETSGGKDGDGQVKEVGKDTENICK